jgi:hypothetical protein
MINKLGMAAIERKERKEKGPNLKLLVFFKNHSAFLAFFRGK